MSVLIGIDIPRSIDIPRLSTVGIRLEPRLSTGFPGVFTPIVTREVVTTTTEVQEGSYHNPLPVLEAREVTSITIYDSNIINALNRYFIDAKMNDVVVFRTYYRTRKQCVDWMLEYLAAVNQQLDG